MAPEADVVENRVFVFDGSLATSAGVTAEARAETTASDSPSATRKPTSVA